MIKCLKDKTGLPIDRAHNDPIMDTRMYEVEYKDGHKALLAANKIAVNMPAQFNGEGNWHVLFQEIVDHRYEGTEVKEQDALIMTHTGTKHCRETTKGVEVLVQWKDGSTTWVTLKDMKNSYPVHMDSYAVHRRIEGDLVFVWWIRHVLEKCNCVI